MNKILSRTLLMCALGGFGLATDVMAADAVPTQMHYQGRVQINNVAYTGNGFIKCALIKDGTTTVWSNDGTSSAGSEPSAAVAVTFTSGVFSLQLGASPMQAMDPSLYATGTLRLRVWVSIDGVTFTQLSEDRELATNAYSFKAGSVAQNAVDTTGLQNGVVTVDKIASASTAAAGQVLAYNGTGLEWQSQGSAPVASVNTKTGVVVLSADDIAEGSTNKYYPAADAAKVALITATQSVDVDTLATQVAANTAKVGISTAQAAEIAANTAKIGITTAQADAITANTAKAGISPEESTKLGYITATQAVDLDTLETSVAANSAKVGISTAQSAEITANTAKVGITTAQAAEITANTAKTGISTAEATKLGHVSVTQAVDLDALESSVAVNTAKTGITTVQAAEITANTAKAGITTAESTKIGHLSVTQAVDLDALESSVTANAGKVGITTAQAAEITANTAKVGITTAQVSEITANTAKVGITTAQANAITANTAKAGITTTESTKLGHLSVTQGVDLDALESNVVANTAKVGITTAQSAEITANTAKVGITTAQASAIAANTAKAGITTAESAKLGHLSVTQGVDLDTLESNVTANNAKVGITTAQSAEITANTAKVGITTAQANAITANTAKAGITTAQSAEITANTAKVGITTAQASAITANTAKAGITTAQSAEITANTAKVGITTAQASAITANTAKAGITTAESTKLGHLSVTQAVDVDTLESNVTANNAKVGITTAQSSEITANTAKVGITTAQANAITANTAKAGITTAESTKLGHLSVTQAVDLDSLESNVTANNAKVGITTAQASEITANTAKISNVQADWNASSGSAQILNKPKDNLVATAAPSSSDDGDSGFTVNSHWVDTTNDNVYVCVDASSGGAIWKMIGPGSLNSWDYDADTNKIANVVDPASAQDAATKNYVDTRALADLADADASLASALPPGYFLFQNGSSKWTAGNIATNASLSDAKIWVGGSGGKAAEISVSGDATLANDGTLSLADGSVATAEISNNSILPEDLNEANSPTSGQMLSHNGSQFLWVAPDTIDSVAGRGATTTTAISLGDASSLASSAAPTVDKHIANKKYVDDKDGHNATHLPVRLISVDETLLISDRVVICNPSTAMTVTLPAGDDGKVFTITSQNLSNSVTITPNAGDTIDGGSSVDLYVEASYRSITIIKLGTAWHIISAIPASSGQNP